MTAAAFIIGMAFGGVVGIVFMCLFQINKGDRLCEDNPTADGGREMKK